MAFIRPRAGSLRRRLRNLVVPRAIILLYHRVAEPPSDPQLLCVRPKHFAEHLEIVRELGCPARLRELEHALRKTRRGRASIVITLDDGYADNLHNAKPVLERYDVPATVFVATGYVKSGREFWQDELDRIFLQPGRLPETLRLDVNGTSHNWELGDSAEYTENMYSSHRSWNVLRKDNPSARHMLYRCVFSVLANLANEERQKHLNHLLSWAGLTTAARDTHAPLSDGEIRRLAEGGLVEVGAHTVNHPVLSSIPEDAQANEISQSKADLEEILGSPVTSFAYPYGGTSHYTQETIGMVRGAGFERACSNFSGAVRLPTDRFQLPRFLVRDWPGNEFANRLQGWLRE